MGEILDKDMNKLEYIQIHLFIKDFNNKKNVKYLNTFLLNNRIKLNEKLDVSSLNFGKDIEGFTNLFSYDHIYKNLYRNFNDLDCIYEYIDNYNLLDNYLMNNIERIMSGFYFNYNDIRFQIILKILILTHIGDYGKTAKYLSFIDYKKKNIVTAYFNEFSKTNIFERSLIDTIKIWCDQCNDYISNNPKDIFYHSDIGGDLCDKCYELKKTKFYENVKRIKKAMLMVGKQELFKKDLIKTKEFIKNKKFKLKKKNTMNYLKKLIKIYLNFKEMIIYVKFAMNR